MVSIQTKLFRPHYHDDTLTYNETIFELDPNHTYTNPRLIDLSYNLGDDVYTPSAGALALINRIELLDGDTQVTYVDNFHEIAKFFNLQVSNRFQNGVRNYLSRSSFGYKLIKDVGYQRAEPNPRHVTDKAGYFELSMFMDFFKSNPEWNFQHPRIRIVWNTNFNYTVSSPQAGNKNIKKPSLLVDKILSGGQVPKQYIFKQFERDRLVIPQTADEHLQTTRGRMHGFDGKRVGRAIIQFISSNPNFQDGLLNSSAVNNEALQIYKSGLPMLPSTMTDLNKQHYVNTIWGRFCLLPTQYGLKVDQANANATGTPIDAFVSSGYVQSLVEASSYAAFDFSQEPINDLELEYSRQRVGADYPSTDLVVVAEVIKIAKKGADGKIIVGNVM
jgi:hypothetical protein